MHDDVIPFENALALTEPGKRHLLLGNGFSIACRHDIFDYRHLLEKCDFGKAPNVPAVFRLFATADFERIIRILRDFATLAPLYDGDGTQAELDAVETREALIQTIEKTHPKIPDEILTEEFASCWKFLCHFTNIFTLNYDLLLYWTQMKQRQVEFTDGFMKHGGVLTWDPDHYSSKKTIFLHGALHLHEWSGRPQKYTWTDNAPPILQQVAADIRNDRYPLFVCEGKAEEKMVSIKRSEYLRFAFVSLGEMDESLFIFGHSLRDEDKHIMDQIKDSEISRLFVSVRLADDPGMIADLKGRAFALADKAGIGQPIFFDADSAHVWK